jgi:L-lactate dehydrogenase complex protein LldG
MSRDQILGKLRAARRPFDDAPPRPKHYLPVTLQDDTTPAALFDRFARELTALKGDVFPVEGDAAACAQVMRLLEQHSATRILAWDFAHIPAAGLEAAIRAAGIEIIQPNTHQADRDALLAECAGAQVGITGADAAAATTGTLIVSTAPGRGRIPTILAPAHIAVITLDQIVPRIESWIAAQRQSGLSAFTQSANFCFISGPSRTGDIEMELILGVHGPGKVYVIVKQPLGG